MGTCIGAAREGRVRGLHGTNTNISMDLVLLWLHTLRNLMAIPHWRQLTVPDAICSRHTLATCSNALLTSRDPSGTIPAAGPQHALMIMGKEWHYVGSCLPCSSMARRAGPERQEALLLPSKHAAHQCTGTGGCACIIEVPSIALPDTDWSAFPSGAQQPA
jgi:hypothetical protein